jgi:hypothetical protein
MIISVINHTNGKLSDEEVQRVIRAINRQITEDFEPYWSLGATLRLEGKSTLQPQKQDLPDMRGDAVLYLWDDTDIPGALGYHDTNNRGIPFGFVFTELSASLGENWTVTFSHEALELIADPEVNLLVAGPHPADPAKLVFHWYEMCDAVQSETYSVDDVEVSNFVLPLYFTGSEETGGRNDFLGRTNNGKTLVSFGVNPGGYVGFFNPDTGEHETFSRKDDQIGKARIQMKTEARSGRRLIRLARSQESSKPVLARCAPRTLAISTAKAKNVTVTKVSDTTGKKLLRPKARTGR